MALIPMFKSLFDMEEVSLNDVMKFQRNLVAPTPRPDMRDIIYKAQAADRRPAQIIQKYRFRYSYRYSYRSTGEMV